MVQNPDQRRAEVADKATDVFVNREVAESWLNTPHPAFGLKRPLEMLFVEGGPEQVMELLCQIEYGIPR